jgi:hypothetical protein
MGSDQLDVTDKFKADSMRAAIRALSGLEQTAIMLEKYAREIFPEVNAQGQVHFGRAMMEAAAESIRSAWTDAIKEAGLSHLPDSEQVERLKQWVADLQSGMFVNCVYCGHRYGPGETAPVAMADALKAHVAVCPEHPMSGLLKATTAAVHALRSYQHGNTATDLAEGVADSCEAAIAKVRP